jgi:hypothetical protein
MQSCVVESKYVAYTGVTKLKMCHAGNVAARRWIHDIAALSIIIDPRAVEAEPSRLSLARGRAAEMDRSNVVARRRGRTAAAGPVGVEELAARPVDPLIRVSAEVITLGLKQVGGKSFAPVAVEVGKG